MLRGGDRGDTASTSSRSHGGHGASEPRLFEFGDRGRILSPRCVEISKQHPEEFLNYLQQAWKRDKIYAKANPDSMLDLKALKVLCQDGKYRPLGSCYIPLPKLMYLQSRYMLEGETFPFLRLNPPLKPDGGFGPWRCLRAFARYRDNLDFFLEMLIRIRRQKSPTVEFPRRILELYLRIQAECEDSRDLEDCQQRVRDVFEKEQLLYIHPIWRPPSECLMDDLCDMSSTLSKSALFPVAEDWDASKSELASLRDFYSHTLEVQSASFRTILGVLERREFDAPLDPSDLWLTDDFYRALDKLRRKLSPQDAAEIRTAFAENMIIAVAPGESVIWLNSSDCTWAPKLDSPEVNDLSKHYPELKDFFTKFLGIQKNDAGLVFDSLVNVASLSPGNTRDDTARGLLVAVSQKIPEYGHVLDKEKFLRSPVFPVLTPDGDVLLCAATMEFSISDRKYLKDAFIGKLNLLDFDPKTVWMLDNLLVWAGLEERYLSRKVEEMGPASDDFKSIELSGEISSKASQLLRIAVHFRSPRTSNPKATSWLLEVLEHAQVRLVSSFPSRLIYRSGNAEIVVENTLGGLDIKDTVGLVINVDDENWELLKQTVLPRRLLEWMMTDPDSGDVEEVTELGVSLVRSILNVSPGRDHIIPRMLDAEGIVDVEALNASPYWRLNSEPTPEPTPPAKTIDEPEPPLIPIEEPPTRHRRPTSKGSAERHDFDEEDDEDDAQSWEREFVADEATLLNFSVVKEEVYKL
ncbi:hypothetical protein CEP51_004600 [Fusarium floridanum]|uniref:Uncharacterized protein n=1 Tax=Fusarium floridanum TaxID=1325733 RepID=A0A428S0D5_9HYPO|nr:hypothetical protein CEP51_004600 [Fusarium floridanum]